MPVWDLAGRENWELLLIEQRNVTYKDGKSPSDSRYSYTPISPIYITPQSHLLLVGLASNSALRNWFLGARASQYLFVSPSNTGNFASGVQVEDTKRLGLNRLTLFEFKNYNFTPYILQLEIPYWLEDIYVEVWQYTGSTGSDNPSGAVDAITQDLARIESKIDAIENYGM